MRKYINNDRPMKALKTVFLSLVEHEKEEEMSQK